MQEAAELLAIPPRDISEDETETTRTADLLDAEDPPSDPTPEQTLRLIEISGSFDFWDAPEEDIYSPDDGSPL